MKEKPKLLGQNRSDSHLAKKAVEFTGNTLFGINFTVKGKVYDVMVDELVSIKKDYSDWTDVDLSIHLEQCSFWRTAFSSAIAEFTSAVTNLSLDHKQWYAAAAKEAREEALKWRKEKKAEGDFPNSWFGSVTKQEIEDWILLDPKYSETYIKNIKEIEHFKIKRDRLIDLRDTIVQRASDLKKLIDDRMDQRGKNYSR